MYEVSSEIYSEADFVCTKLKDGKLTSEFSFDYPVEDEQQYDSDGDFILPRKKEATIVIDHLQSTIIKLVGLQIWRGALVLADYILDKHNNFSNKVVLELGAGVGLTSIVAGMVCKKVISTDIDQEGSLNLIRANIRKNQNLIKSNVYVTELDFTKPKFSTDICSLVEEIDIIIAADVIYDNDLTDHFISVIEMLFSADNLHPKTLYLAAEKRYVFTIEELDVVAPCFDYFMKKIIEKSWLISFIPIDFKSFFKYRRCKELVLLSIKKSV